VVREWEEVEALHGLHHELRRSPFVSDRQSQLQQVVLDGSGVAGHVDQVVQAAAPAQRNHDVPAEPGPRRVEDGDYPVASEAVAHLLDLVLGPAQQDLVVGIVVAGVLDGFGANLYSDDLEVGHFAADGDADGADAAAEVQHHVALLHRFDDLRVEHFAHVDVDLQEGGGRHSEEVVADAFVVVALSEQDFWLFGGHAVGLPVVLQEAQSD
jgi:hypothetical protein